MSVLWACTCIDAVVYCSINGNDTCTELLLESKGSVIVSLPDAKGRSACLVNCNQQLLHYRLLSS